MNAAIGTPPEVVRLSEQWLCAPKPVLLTFDDGPSILATPLILSTLKQHRIHAVFFLVGERLKTISQKNIVRSAMRDGHWIGNHSYSHPDLSWISELQLRKEIADTRKILDDLGVRERLFRAPFGVAPERLFDLLKLDRYSHMTWNIDPRDWHDHYQPNAWIDRCLEKIATATVARGYIILLHDSHLTTAIHLERLIAELKAIGCSFPPFFSALPSATSAPLWTSAFHGWSILRDLPFWSPFPAESMGGACEESFDQRSDSSGDAGTSERDGF